MLIFRTFIRARFRTLKALIPSVGLVYLLLHSLVFANQTTPCSCNTEPFTAQRAGSAYTWTLTSKLAQILRAAEQRYGRRNPQWTLLGIEFSTDKQPKIWYPYAQQGEQFIIVQLTQAARCNPELALFQLSHEVIHLLSPLGGNKPSNVFEEGLASYFSLQILQQQGYRVRPDYITNPAYRAAYHAILSLYAVYPNSDTIIKTLRKDVQTFKQLSPQQLQKAFPNIDTKLVQQLLAVF